MIDRPAEDRTRSVEFSGRFERSQVVVGEHNVVTLYEGTVVQHLPPGEIPTPTPRARPQTRLPKPVVPPLGREREAGSARTALGNGLPAEFYGPPGIGKSCLISYLTPELGPGWADGVVHSNVGGVPPEDVLQWLFEVFWMPERPWAPGRLRVAEYIRPLRVLIALDDVGFSAGETASLINALEHATLLIGSTEAHLDPAQGAVALAGLPGPAGVAAFARALRQPLDESESSSVSQLVERLEGVPGLVLDAARAVRDGVCNISEVVSQPASELERRRVLTLSDPQRRVLALLAELTPAAVPVELLESAASASASDADALETMGLAESRSPRYALARPLAPAVREELPRLEPGIILAPLTDAGRGGSINSDWAPTTTAGLEWGLRAGDFDAVVETARAVETPLLLALRTGAWGAALAAGAAAARECGRPSDEAFFLHQQGTRWLCLGERERAQDCLRRALALRVQLDEQAAAAATLHNLGVMGGWDDIGALDRARVGPTSAVRASPWFAGRLGRFAFGAVGLALGVLLGIIIGRVTSAQRRTATEARTVVIQPGRTVTVTTTGAPIRTIVRATTPSAPTVITTTAFVTSTTTATRATTITTSPVTTPTVTETVSSHNSVCIDC